MAENQSSNKDQQLFDKTIRIDERVKSIQSKYGIIERHIEEINNRHISIITKLVETEQKQEQLSSLNKEISDCEEVIRDINNRLIIIEKDNGRNQDRWNKTSAFLIQLIWVILSAYVLTKLNLQAPAVP